MSNGPKSFKEMQFPPARIGARTAIYAPLPPSPIGKTISASAKSFQIEKMREMKELINSQRCPLCGAQLEGAIRWDRSDTYCCANGKSEYIAIFQQGLNKPYFARATLYASRFGYQIENQHIKDDIFFNSLYRIDLSLSEKYQMAEREKLLSYEGQQLLLNKGLTEKELLQKIELYNLFS